MTIDELLRSRLADRLEVGRGIDLREVRLRVLSLSDGRADRVSVVIPAASPQE